MLVVLTACSGSVSVPVSESTASPSATPSATLDPEVAKALDAYEAYMRTSNAALESPVSKGQPWPSGADFTRWAYDPAQAETSVYVHALAAYKAEYRGKPPVSNNTVDEVDLDASPYPSVKLTDCQVPQGLYVPYSRETDEQLPLEGDVNLDDPYPVSVELISVKGKWGVKSAEADREKSCKP
ncbi:hypothetical protein KIH74_34990 [Kineosporia sp. J2-2]|uniref:Lipoprotein n=1 Tax=Kineosporia corallincola TaxID=2835133 RepID=A0ABS5TTY6_9ACTN|nr:hypothetical protein [Kineosporia corallincola]MBT0774204.1 hypothetical protein [Kineosporia corallincola]